METLYKFSDFINEILSNNSRNYKIEVLNKYKDDEDIKYYLNYIYNPYLITGISDKKIHKYSDNDVILHHPVECSVKELLEDILKNNTGKDDILQTIANFKCFNLTYRPEEFEEESDFESLWEDDIDDDIDDYLKQDDDALRMLNKQAQNEVNSEYANELRDLLDKIITKNLNLGIDVKTINKVFDNLIPTFNVQLADKYFEHPEAVEGKRFFITEKIDGCRIIALKQNNKVEFYTRQGQPYIGLVDLEKELMENFPDNICLDGEITLLDSSGIASKDAYKETTKIVRTKDTEKHGVKMLVFDCMLASEFKLQDCQMDYEYRRFDLDNLFKYKNKYFELLPVLYQGSDTSMIMKILDQEVAKQHEGIMINIADALYKFDRCRTLLKCKKFQDIDLEVIGFEEGTNKNIGKLGAIICKYKDNNIVKVGGGYTDEERSYIWNHQDEYLNKVITVKYFEETKNANGGISLRFPVYAGLRFDKGADI